MSSDEQKAASLLVIFAAFAWLFLTDWPPPPPTGSTGAYLFLRLAT